MRFQNRSRSSRRRTRRRNRRQKLTTYIGGAFDTVGVIRVSTNPAKRLIVSFDDNIEFPTNNIRMYVRESLTEVKKRDFGNGHLTHNYLDIPISECSPNDVIKIKFLYVQWAKSLPDGASVPDFRWSDALNTRWIELNAASKKAELTKLQALFAAADYVPLYAELITKYEDPFGGAFDDLASSASSAIAASSLKRKPRVKRRDPIDTAVLEKMNRANAELEQSQARLLQTRRNPPTRMQKLMSAIRRVTKPNP